MNKLSLKDVQWGEFFIGGSEGLFDISSTKSGIDKNKLNHISGRIPYITRTENSNGINLFVSNDQGSKFKINNGNVITIGLDTQTVFYQKSSFFTGQNIQILYNEKLTKNIALFIIPLLKIQMKKFSWGSNGATLGRLNRTKILLPIKKNGQPNWKFMEEYIKQESSRVAKSVYNYYHQRNKLVLDINLFRDVEWREFRIEDIAGIYSGKDIYDRERNEGNIPYITASANQNGIGYFVNNTNATLQNKCISVNRNGSVGYSFYHDYEALFGNDTRKLVPIFEDKYASIFLTNVIQHQKNKYGYGYKLGTGRLKQQKIILPIDNEGKPFWEYMSNYIKIIQTEKVNMILDYLYRYLDKTT